MLQILISSTELSQFTVNKTKKDRFESLIYEHKHGKNYFVPALKISYKLLKSNERFRTNQNNISKSGFTPQHLHFATTKMP